ncbi:tetratricopeptide repeat protein [Undibacterium sp. LX40W]|uniref:Tetratricopeptide repeat protein n=1 Tax=Undibacterium nitidum TaxID=2762298 RepID=A0A923KLR2_9BURK|nr:MULTISPECIES: tetratricopeptide repeat protein [Undibacterium]MBC3882120.1 tetratricopeptide repeat protein [Undibacterium nitidum]MBC3892401.1 tetratricopeptide repeat protein [Undibacterium sp. LX40W]
MSLINQMLQDLEKRGEEQGANSESASQYAQYGSKLSERRFGIRFFILACLGLVFACLVYFLVYRFSANHLGPKDELKTKVETAATTQMTDTRSADAELLKTASLPLLLKMSTKIDVVTNDDSPRVDIEKTMLTEPLKKQNPQESNRENVQLESSSKPISSAVRNERPLPVIAEIKRADGSQIDLSSNKAASDSSAKPDYKQTSTNADKSNLGQSAVIKEISPQQRAEGEFKQATIYQQQGRNSEAILSLEQALKLDSNHAPARQLMISLLLETKRYDDAIRELRAGLANDSHQINFAMILARLLVERAKVNEAVEILQKAAPFAQDRPDYLAFLAALQQKLGRHKEAIQSYRLALNKHAQNAVWWMGMGISLQADGANAEALEAYRQAKTQPGLGADLLAFVDQKIAQIQK